MSSNIDYDIFINRYYGRLVQDERLPMESIDEIGRYLWYCNESGRIIMDLVDFNKCQLDEMLLDEFEQKYNDEILSDIYFNKGYSEYNVYKCGHCIYLVYYLSGIFDHVYSNLSTMIELREKGKEALYNYVDNLIKDDKHLCPICKFNITSKNEIYLLSTRNCTGTIILKNYIPKKYLPYIKNDFKAGTIVDTKGYRGTGLYIFDNNKFTKLDRREYYPILTKDLLDTYGYINILSQLQRIIGTHFDKLYITKKIFFVGEFFYTDRTEKDNYTYLETSLKKGMDTTDTYEIYNTISKEFVELVIENDTIIVPNKYLGADMLNYFCDSKILKYKILLNDMEYMMLGNDVIIISDGTNSVEF